MPIKFKAILPDKFNGTAFLKDMTESVDPIRWGARSDYMKGYSTWSNESKPQLRSRKNPKKGVLFEIILTGDIYFFIHQGTEGPYPITARKAPMLAFLENYKAKTKPGQIQSMGGGASGPLVYAITVTHPGIEGRFFTTLIVKKWRPAFERAVNRGLDDAVKKSGHAI